MDTAQIFFFWSWFVEELENTWKHGKNETENKFLIPFLTNRTYAYHPCVSSWGDRVLHFSQWLGFSPWLPIEAPSSSIDGSPCPPFPGSLGGEEKGRKQAVTFEWYFLLTRAKVSIVPVSVSLVSQDSLSSKVSSSHPRWGLTLGTMWAFPCFSCSPLWSHMSPRND